MELCLHYRGIMPTTTDMPPTKLAETDRMAGLVAQSALISTLLPSIRRSRVNPAEALRAE